MILWRSWLLIILKNRWSQGEAVFEEDPADLRARKALLGKYSLEKGGKKSRRLVLKLRFRILVIKCKHEHKTYNFNCL